MKRKFNVTGSCNPQIHYMVDITDRLEKIKVLVDNGDYFTINRARQYGKTTTIRALADYLEKDYIVISLDFQRIGNSKFATEHTFTNAFANYLKRIVSSEKKPICGLSNELIEEMAENVKENEDFAFDDMFPMLSDLCSTAVKPVVMIIDEVDSATNNQVFLDFLAQLRSYYLDRAETSTFQSVILAGVYDVKNIKMKIRPDSEHKVNSPWNIATDFLVDMSFNADDIKGMLAQYEADHHTGMDMEQIAAEIYEYTSGYPYLVSRICQMLDEIVPGREGFEDAGVIWSHEGIDEAVKLILNSKIPLFESMTRQLQEHPDIKRMLQQILMEGLRIPYNAQNELIDLATMFGYIVNKNGAVRIANRIFETCLYNLFISEEVLTNAIYGKAQEDISQFIKDGKLDMDQVITKFVEYFTEIYGDNDEKFVENYGRKFFLLYLKPIINGTGNYYIEAQTRDAKRTDVIVDYRGEQFVIEMKIWRGNEYNERGEAQLADYLDYYHKDKGYLVSFNFNKNKQVGVRMLNVGNKTILEAVV